MHIRNASAPRPLSALAIEIRLAAYCSCAEVLLARDFQNQYIRRFCCQSQQTETAWRLAGQSHGVLCESHCDSTERANLACKASDCESATLRPIYSIQDSFCPLLMRPELLRRKIAARSRSNKATSACTTPSAALLRTRSRSEGSRDTDRTHCVGVGRYFRRSRPLLGDALDRRHVRSSSGTGRRPRRRLRSSAGCPEHRQCSLGSQPRGFCALQKS